MEASLTRIETVDGQLGAFVRTYPEEALAGARRAEARFVREGRMAPVLCGVPLALKDLIAVAGLPLTLGVKAWAGFEPVRSAEVWRLLEASGAVLVGHTATHELGYGSITPQTVNPWDPARAAGGSSGGSAAAIAAGMVPVAIGTDTGGSLRNPASMCGVAAIKPTAGAVSTLGVSALAPSMDTVGPMAVEAGEAVAALSTLSSVRPDRGREGSRGGRALGGLRIGYASDGWLDGDLAAGVDRQWRAFKENVACLGAELVEVEPPPDPRLRGLPLNELIVGFEFLARYDDIDHIGGPALSTSTLRALDRLRRADLDQTDYLCAQRRRAHLRQDYQQMFAADGLHAYVVPTLAVEPPSRVEPALAMPPVGRSLRAVFNLTGHPVVTVPIGLSPETGLPVGVQVAGPEWTEGRLAEIGARYQAAFPLSRPGRTSVLLSNRFEK